MLICLIYLAVLLECSVCGGDGSGGDCVDDASGGGNCVGGVSRVSMLMFISGIFVNSNGGGVLQDPFHLNKS